MSSYRDYFDIDEEYFPQVNDSTIEANPDYWKHTYPHQAFIKMLNSMEKILSRQDRRSLWIEGSYGTGKSMCAYALKKILEVSDEELRTYWERYEPLKNKLDLLEKLVGHRQKGIITVHRYASGSINSPRKLFLEVQESISTVLNKKKLYTGENTLKDSVIAWLEDNDHKIMFDSLLQNSDKEWKALFPQSNTKEILDQLKSGKNIKNLMDNLFRLADKEGITALNIDSDRLLTWISDVIDRNNIKIVFIWDEFSDYFRNNRDSLSEFQKLAELVNSKPFYFIIVTHESGQLFLTADKTWQKVRDRFIQIQIDLPDNIAFNLIGHAFNIKPAARDNWDVLSDDLNSRVSNSRAAVMKLANITDQKVIKDIMPLHPMAAILLINIASAFKSNQRSMFDFIKSSDTSDVKAFQWFIDNIGPLDDHPLLTVDMLWNFFYEKGKEDLTTDIRLILDTFSQQQNLSKDEKSVLKAILIMQAIDQHLSGTIDLFKPTVLNLSYVFEGLSSGLDVSYKSIANHLVAKGILIKNPISDGRYAYTAAVLAGDQTKIDNHKKDIRAKIKTSNLVDEGGLSTVLSLSPALRLRFESEPGTGKITTVTIDDFTRKINYLSDKDNNWKFNSVIAFAKNEEEAISFRSTIKTAVANERYKNIVFIDALSTPLGSEAFEKYLNYSSMAMYYNGNNNLAARENSDKAKHILDQDWKNRIYNGQFIVYTYTNQEGEKLNSAESVASVLQTIVTNRFPFIFDFNKGLSESQLKITSGKASAKSGIIQYTTGVVIGIEKNVLSEVWKIDKYWENSSTAQLPISKIKVEIDNLVENTFKRDGRIYIGDLYDILEKKFGFAPCNLSAFLTGFLLKEYGCDNYRYSDSLGAHEPMTPEKLAEMIGNYIGKSPKHTYIVKMTPEEMAFYDLTEKAWHITPNSCSSAGQAAIALTAKMRGLGLPVWCLAEVDDYGIYDVVQKYIELAQKEGNEAHKIAVEIGKIAKSKITLSENLAALLTIENCQKGMGEFLKSFEDGRLLSLANDIGASENLLSEIRNLFEVKHSCLWNKQTGEGEIKKLLINYGIVKESNLIMNVNSHSLNETFKEWRERLKFIHISCEQLQNMFSTLNDLFNTLSKIYKHSEILPEQLKSFLSELTTHGKEIRDLLNNEQQIFTEAYAQYLENFNDSDIIEIKSNLEIGMFEFTKIECNEKVKNAAEEFSRKQLKTKLFNFWREKTGTKNPLDWSKNYRTPILCCIPEREFDKAKKTFETLNRSWSKDVEIKAALEFLQTTNLFDDLNDENKRNSSFQSSILGTYSPLLQNLEEVRNALESLSIETYDWLENPRVKNKVRQLAEAEYNAGGSNKALTKIDKMDDSNLKRYLKRLVKENMTVGIEIITDGDN